MGEITRQISFGMGVPAQERVDHPVLDKIRSADFAPQCKLAQLAESQLGTVGSGNHFDNLMADEGVVHRRHATRAPVRVRGTRRRGSAKVLDILGAEALHEVHNNHNDAQYEYKD